MIGEENNRSTIEDWETYYYMPGFVSGQDGSEFYVLIGYPCGQDRPILPARDCPLCSRNLDVIFRSHNKPFIDQACLVKMAEYWPS